MKSNANNKGQKFTIIVRVKPELPEDERTYKPTQIQQVIQTTSKTVQITRKNNQQKIFKFNRVFKNQEQAEIFIQAAHLVQSIFDGYNSTFLAYGQTGTGKTHTIFGNISNSVVGDGILYRSVQNIFMNINARKHIRQFAVRVSFLEFYLDNIYDLLQNDRKKLEIKQNSEDGITIKNLTQQPVKSMQDLFSCIKQAVRLRKTQETSINKRSSRSHAIIQVAVLQRWNQDNDTKYLKGTLKIVDLAGSERVSKTQSYGNRLQQAKRINKQITTLGKCINMLAQAEKQGKSVLQDKFNFNRSFIPYRDSKITRYLSESLSGKSKIVLCVCISKYNVHLEESFSSLLFASQASTLKIESIRNQVYSFKKSVEKPVRGAYQTPIKSKSQYKGSTNTENQGNDIGTKLDSKKQFLIEKFKQQISQIQYFLQNGNRIPNNTNQPQVLNGLKQYQKIFQIMRSKYERLKNQY